MHQFAQFSCNMRSVRTHEGTCPPSRMCWPLSRNFPFAGLLVLPSFLEAISGVTEVLKRTAEAKKENRLWCGSKWKKFQWNWMENTEGGKKMTHLWKERNDSICFSRCCWRAVVGGSWDLDAFDPNIQLILRKLREIELEVCAAKAYEPAIPSAILN